MSSGPRRGRSESPAEKFLRLEKSGAALVKVNVGRLTPDGADDDAGAGDDRPTTTSSRHEPAPDRD
jgi:hypothetical protein